MKDLYDVVQETKEKLQLKLGLTLPLKESIIILTDIYGKINQEFPQIHALEDRIDMNDVSSIVHKEEKPMNWVNPYSMFNIKEMLGKEYNKYLLARNKYVEHIMYLHDSRGVYAEPEEILPPYVVFPEQSQYVSHGIFTVMFERYIEYIADRVGQY